MRAIQDDPGLDLRLLVGGTHLSPQHGYTVRDIEADGFVVSERIDAGISADTPHAITHLMAKTLAGFADAFARDKPDILVIEGDRFEMFAAALASVPFSIPIAHMGGGDVTLGAMDDALRHALTKLSHLHFASTDTYAARIIQMGEEPWRVCVSGEPNVDSFVSMHLLSRDALREKYQLDLPNAFLLATYHPVTLQAEETEWQIMQFLRALEESALPVIFTMPNADTGNRHIRSRIEEFVECHPAASVFENLGLEAYASVMALATAIVGNSSSGILEAASFKLPVVNVGIRQGGRVCSKNVINVGNAVDDIVTGIRRAVQSPFRHSLNDLVNPYATGCAISRILDVLKHVELGPRLLQKRFYDLPVGPDTRLQLHA